MKASEIKVICFDYYGTLVDIGNPFGKIENWFSRFLGKEKSSISLQQFNTYFTKQRAKFFYNTHFYTGSEILEKSYVNTCQKFALKPYIDDFKIFASYLFTMPTAYDDAAKTISILKQKYKVCLVTNADNYILWESIKTTGFNFDFIITSEYAQSNKPSARIFEMTMKRANASSNQAVMVGDSLSEDIFGAQMLGINVIWINRENKPCQKGVTEVKQIKEILKLL